LLRALCLGSLIFLCIFFGFAFGPVSAQGSLPKYIDEYSIPTAASAPLAITVDRNGMVWFTESNASKLARFDPSTHSFIEYHVPGVGDMWGIALDHNGYVWFTQYSARGNVNPGGAVVSGGTGRLGRLDPTQSNCTFIDVPTEGSFPMRLVADSQDRIWFTELLGNKIGVYDQSKKQLTEYSVPTNASGPADLAFDKNGVLWFTETYARQLGKFFSQNQTFLEYPLGNGDSSQIVSSPVGLAFDDMGNVWVADHGGSWIVEFNPVTQGIVKFPTHSPPEDVYPISLVNDLVADSKGRIWFVEHGGNSIGCLIIQNQTMYEFPIPTGPISTSLWIALSPSNEVWFTEWSADKIGVLHSHMTIPISIETSDNYLSMTPGDETTISLVTETSQAITGNGTMRYSWSSYNPNDVSIAFSPQYPSLTGLSSISGQAELTLSNNIKPGNYTLGLGIDTGEVTVWSMIRVQVAPQGSTTPDVTTTILESVAAVTLVFVLGLVWLGLRSRRQPQA
jgi:virginiamycin B lyase